jgi:hypothetical protein
MNTKNFLRRIGVFILAALLLPGMAMLFSTTAQAQGRAHRRVIIVRPIRPYHPYGWYGRYPYGDPFNRYDYYRQYVFKNGEAAEQQGYHDGLKTGSEDGRKGKSYDPERSHYFHDAGFGNFAEAYRSGFSRGYRDGYSG